VISTLHTNTAASSIDRIIDSFPADAKNQLRLQLANSLLGVVSQRLVKKAEGSGRVVACEILAKSPTVEKLIAENRFNELDVTMEASNDYYQMQSMNQALERMVRAGSITQDEALLHSDKKEDLSLKLSGMVAVSQGGVDAKELLDQQAESTKLVQRPAEAADIRTGEFDLPSSAQPKFSGIQMEGGAGRRPQAARPPIAKKKPA
jgi:Tfp pilus assembly ATPase PilU